MSRQEVIGCLERMIDIDNRVRGGCNGEARVYFNEHKFCLYHTYGMEIMCDYLEPTGKPGIGNCLYGGINQESIYDAIDVLGQ